MHKALAREPLQLLCSALGVGKGFVARNCSRRDGDGLGRETVLRPWDVLPVRVLLRCASRS